MATQLEVTEPEQEPGLWDSSPGFLPLSLAAWKGQKHSHIHSSTGTWGGWAVHTRGSAGYLSSLSESACAVGVLSFSKRSH